MTKRVSWSGTTTGMSKGVNGGPNTAINEKKPKADIEVLETGLTRTDQAQRVDVEFYRAFRGCNGHHYAGFMLLFS